MTLGPVKAIRWKCLGCQGDSPSQVRLCVDTGCPLHFYRMGKNPNRKGVGGRKPISTPKTSAQV
jgi:hypothetical protein